MDPVTSSLYLDQFQFKYILKEEIPRVLDLLRVSLWPVFGIYGYDEETMQQDWRELFRGMLERSCGPQGTSFMVTDTKTSEIVGARVIVIKNRPEKTFPPNSTTQGSKDIFEFLTGLLTQIDIWEEYPNITQFAEMFGISVSPEYRRKGIASEIYKRSLKMLISRGVKVGRCRFISNFSRKAASKLGGRIYGEVRVIDAKTPNGRYFNPTADPQEITNCCIFELFKAKG